MPETPSRDSRPPRMVVVGGGISGLVAARALARAGAQVQLFEAGDRLGGRIRSTTLAETGTIDVGAEAFATRGGTVRAFLTELGLDDRVIAPASLGSWVVDAVTAHAVPLPPGGALGIPARPLTRAAMRSLGLFGALRAAVEPWLPRWVGRTRTAKPGSLGALVRARLGQRVLDRVVRPVCLGVYSADPDRLELSAVPGLAAAYVRQGSLLRAARELRTSAQAAGGAIAGLQGGMTVLIDALATELGELGVEVHTGVAIASLDEICTVSATGEASAAASGIDGVVLAVPESAARGIIGEATAGAGRSPSSVEDLIEIIALAVDDARLAAAPRGTGALVAPAAMSGGATGGDAPVDASQQSAAPNAIRAKALTHVSAKWPHRAAGGPQVIRLSYGRAGWAPETLGLSDADARARACLDASRILGVRIDPSSVRDMARQRWHAGGPSRTDARLAGVSVQTSAQARAQANAPETSHSGAPVIECAGDWVSGTGLASVIPGAIDAAERLLAALPTPGPPGATLEPPAQHRPAPTHVTDHPAKESV